MWVCLTRDDQNRVLNRPTSHPPGRDSLRPKLNVPHGARPKGGWYSPPMRSLAFSLHEHGAFARRGLTAATKDGTGDYYANFPASLVLPESILPRKKLRPLGPSQPGEIDPPLADTARLDPKVTRIRSPRRSRRARPPRAPGKLEKITGRQHRPRHADVPRVRFLCVGAERKRTCGAGLGGRVRMAWVLTRGESAMAALSPRGG